MTEKQLQSDMIDQTEQPSGLWTDGVLPSNVRIGAKSIITEDYAFKRFNSKRDPALIIGESCTLDGVHFALGEEGRVQIGNYCYFTHIVLLCELELAFGDYVVIGWNTTIADTDFHPIAPAARIADAIACSPLGKNLARPEILRKKVTVEDDVWIGPNVTILKGVNIGAGAFIEAGTMVVRDIPSRARVAGNPAQIIGRV
ncbi:MAG TPA: acyltransferase [Pyrinomonadaceae bacterium]|jgi:acetyltransferase-like isoleucine patch superfamily enzyme